MKNLISSWYYSRFHNLHIYVGVFTCLVTASYLVTSGSLHWYYYVKLKKKSEEWKCQKKFPERKEIIESAIRGTLCSILAAVLGAIVICYTMNGGYTTAYYNVSDYGIPYLILSIPLLFVYNEMVLYYAHRILHIPVVYKSIHKQHYKYKQPTAFSTISMHPLEVVIDELAAVSSLFLFPIHWAIFFGVHAYTFHYSLLEHSGIKFKPIWPWHPSSKFHDMHHEFFEVNYGHFMTLFDRIHGTWKDDKENVAGGNSL